MGGQGTCDTARWFPAVPAFLAKRSLSPDWRPHRGHSGHQVVALTLAIVDPSAGRDQLVVMCESGAGGETDVELRHSVFYRSCPQILGRRRQPADRARPDLGDTWIVNKPGDPGDPELAYTVVEGIPSRFDACMVSSLQTIHH